MYLGQQQITRKYVRFRGEIGHALNRTTQQYLFRCDGCGCQFTRTSKHIKKSQLIPGVLHACPSCQGPHFAAKASSLRKQTLDQDASSMLNINDLR
jgi:hypothetical protein